jgi:uncharacterized phiE125 gp8 family phage protein
MAESVTLQDIYDFLRLDTDNNEDTLLSSLILAAEQYAEGFTRRKFITETCYYYLEKFPAENFIRLPYGKLQSITSITYKDSDGTETTMVKGTDYLEDIISEPGRAVLPYGGSWPTDVLYPTNPIIVTFVCGYGATPADIPEDIKTGIKMIVSDLYENRQVQDTQQLFQNNTAYNLLWPYRLWEFDF